MPKHSRLLEEKWGEKAATTHQCEGPAVSPAAFLPALHSLYRDCEICIDRATRSVTARIHYFQEMKLLSYVTSSTPKTGQQRKEAQRTSMWLTKSGFQYSTPTGGGRGVKKAKTSTRSPPMDNSQAATKADALSPFAT